MKADDASLIERCAEQLKVEGQPVNSSNLEVRHICSSRRDEVRSARKTVSGIFVISRTRWLDECEE